jgi:hypothetical protein
MLDTAIRKFVIETLRSEIRAAVGLAAPPNSGPDAILSGADIAPRLGKEEETWRGKKKANVSSDRTGTSGDGESTWSMQEAKRLSRLMRQKAKPAK